ncbi:MAG: universal stress protein [Ilumatobacteraceae bacterium]
MTHVLIAVDDSESSIKTARTAYALFGETANYILVNVADQTPLMWGGDALVWGIGYPIVMAPTGPAAVDQPVGAVTGGEQASGDASAAEVDNAPIEAAIQVARDVAGGAAIPNAQIVGEVGDPATAIINAAHHHQADVIVIGSHDRSWFSKLLAPSVGGAVVREADIPVLITQ